MEVTRDVTRVVSSAVTRAIVFAHRLALESGDRLSPRAVAEIRASLEVLAAAGVTKVAVVDGRHSDALRDQLELDTLPTLTVEVIANLTFRHRTGSATLLARSLVEQGPCLVVRGDRPLDRESLTALTSVRLGAGQGRKGGTISAALMVSSARSLDARSEVRVQLGGNVGTGKVVTALGEDLEEFDALCTGHALIDASLLPDLARLNNPSLEDALLSVVAKAQVVAIPGNAEWSWVMNQPIQVEESVTALLDAKTHPEYMLLNPGPVNTTPGVKSALVHHDVCHRDSTFSELKVSLTGKLRRIYKGTPEHTVVLITGSGTAAMESALTSSVPRDRKILIVDNGAFGERLVEIAKVHEMDTVHLRYSWGEAIKVADVERALQENPEVAVVAMIHHETSVGLLNPVREIGALCREHDALLIVDAVSSLGAEDIDVVRDNIDICYSSANKCLHAVSGASFMCVSPRVWSRIQYLKPRSYYLDLRRYRRAMDEMAQTPFTPAVSIYFALDAACSEFLADGHAKRFATYRRRNRKIRDGLAALGMAPFTASGKESNSITTCCVPAGIEFDELYEALKNRGIIIYGCKSVLAGCFMQIANMGDLPDQRIEAFLIVMGDEIARIRRAKNWVRPTATLTTPAGAPQPMPQMASGSSMRASVQQMRKR